MLRGIKSIALLCLLVFPIILAVQAAPAVHGQPSGETQSTFQQYLSAGYYNYTTVTVQNAAIIGYATDGNVSIDTAFMTGQQLSDFTEPSDINNSVFSQSGLSNYNALLEVPGTYYLVTYSPNAPANVTGLIIVNQDINVQNSTTSVSLFIAIQPGATFTIPLHVETLGSPSQLQILGASNEIVQYGLLNKTAQSIFFRSPYVTITNFTVSPTVSLGYNFTLSPGLYVMGIVDESPSPAYVYFQYNVIPAYVNPYLLNFGVPSPTGIAAYGIYNYSGKVVPYEVTTSSVVGFADVSTLSAVDNGTNSSLASLQENTVLEVNNTDGSLYTYWPQNVLAFDTSVPSVTYRDNVLNTTGDGAQLTNQSIIGTGTTGGITNNGVAQTYYGNYNSNYTYTYTLPQAWVLYTNETVQQGKGVLIQMGVRALDSSDPNKTTWFDKIMIEDPNVASADFVVNGRSYTPAGADTYIGSFYDAELVFGGGAGGQAARFQLNANLALFYLNGTLKPFPSVYTFGDDTAEAAYNIVVTNGTDAAAATAGTPYYGLLTNSFSSSLSTLIAQAGTQQPLGRSSTGLLVAAAVIAIIVILALVVVMRRRSSRTAQVFQAPPVAQPGAVGPQVATAFCPNCGTLLDPSSRFCPNCGAPQVPDEGSLPSEGQPPT